MTAYHRPHALSDALGAMASGGLRLLGGATDLYPGREMRLDGVLDLTAIASLRGITRDGHGLRIGACTTWTEIAEAALPAACAALQQAARQIGGRQIQNVATIGGNLCNASPAADGVPVLLVMDAVVELASHRGNRRLALREFILGPRRVAREPDEILSAVLLPASALAGGSAFEKLGARAHLVISIVSAAARIELVGGRISAAALAVGACSAVPQRLPLVEAGLIGQPARGFRLDAVALDTALSPIDDIRATAAYRRAAAPVLLARAIAGAVS